MISLLKPSLICLSLLTTVCFGCVVLVPWILALFTVVHRRYRRYRRLSFSSSQRNATSDASSSCTRPRVRLMTGRVWHSRYLPKKHSFTYPIFYFWLPLASDDNNQDTVKETAQLLQDQEQLYPLAPWLVHFDPIRDHLKNREGLGLGLGLESSYKNTSMSMSDLQSRIFALCRQRTNSAFLPTSSTHQVYLLTHLRYFGYCFNPVSFYFVMRRKDDKASTENDLTTTHIDAVVGEVSNTPWNEMYCYVLHPHSTDQVQCPSATSPSKLRYIFPKTFHVSPFMEMTYNYNWTFHLKQQLDAHTKDRPSKFSLGITTALEQRTSSSSTPSTDQDKTPIRQFDALLHLTDETSNNNNDDSFLSPFSLAWYLSAFPVFCFIIQIWIHYEAFWLFVKGIDYQPHPNDADTWASKLIGTAMTPLFWIQSRLQQLKDNGRGTEQSTTNGRDTKKSQ